MKRKLGLLLLISVLAVWCAAPPQPAGSSVKAYEGTIDVPTHQPSGREVQPPLFPSSTLGGLYPFPPFILPVKPEGPWPKTYQAVFVENEYLKLTYLPDLGGRFFSLYDKVRKREVFYRNDVIKPSHYNSKLSWPQSGVELTGPYDTHMLTFDGEPFWSYRIVRHEDGSVSLVLGSIDPVYHMKVDLSARLYPGLSAMQISVFCYNAREGRMPHMFWISSAVPARPKTRFIYPMTRTIGHTTSEVGDWPVFNGIDYSWDRNNRHMLGVFGIDIYDDFQGAYDFEIDYGTFRHADRRIVQGMKMWTFGHSDRTPALTRGYTDNAGPYIEVQSGRYVWDGFYEWLAPHKYENWSEWWFPVAGIGGFTTTSRDVALNLEVTPEPQGSRSTVKLGLSANRVMPGSRITVTAKHGEILNTTANLTPAAPFNRSVSVAAGAEGLKDLVVRVSEASGNEVLRYARPDENPGRKEYTPYTRPLERPQKDPKDMSVEELALAAEGKLKQLNHSGAVDLLNQALERDPGYSRAHLLFGMHYFNTARYADAVKHLEQAIDRDPYIHEAYYYLSMSQLKLGDVKSAERNLYFIPPDSLYFANREYQLGRIELLRGSPEKARVHLEKAVMANGYYLDAKLLLALMDREQGNKAGTLARLADVESIDPTSQWAAAERYFLAKDRSTQQALLQLMGGQSQEAISVSLFYRRLNRWKEAAEILRLVEQNNHDVWGTPSEFYYTLAFVMNKLGDEKASAGYRAKARASAESIDRYPYREESEPPLAEAVQKDPKDAVARFYLACLQYYLGRPDEAIRNWESAVEASPADFRTRRALGMAYAEQGQPVEKAAAQLEKAVELKPEHIRTMNDLSAIYAKAGQFDKQLAVLERALRRTPDDDNLAEGVLTVNLMTSRYEEADRVVSTHKFEPRHRTYGLRDKYRFLRYGMGAKAFHAGRYDEALKLFQSALTPPASLGVDDFQFESTPRVNYYIGRVLEAMGRKDEARSAYEKAASGYQQLSGDQDSWNAENYHMVLALARLGNTDAASMLEKKFEEYAKTQMESQRRQRRTQARYLLGLVKKRRGEGAEARRLMEDAVALEPDFLGPRLELRGDVVDKLGA